jgi:hypothetical protein
MLPASPRDMDATWENSLMLSSREREAIDASTFWIEKSATY